MGYTHYWRTSFTQEHREKFAEFSKRARKIIDTAKAEGVKIAGIWGDGLDEEIVDSTQVSFNGFNEGAYETFSINFEMLEDLRNDFSFCKTNHRPYDVVVVAVLTAATEVFDETIFRVSSDGTEEDWVEGERLYARAMAGEVKMPPAKQERWLP